MLFSLLQDKPMIGLLIALGLVMALTVHEFAHALAARLQGDDTAEQMGRLTLNPLAHLDPMGTLLILMIGFGWGKPVPFNPRALRSRYGSSLVALAGPLSNALLVALAIIGLRVFVTFANPAPENALLIFLSVMLQVNVILMVFNLLPIPPLDGGNIFLPFLPERLFWVRAWLELRGPFLLLALIIADRFLNLGLLNKLFDLVFQLVAVFI
jgi:Zn-dependent protease